VKVAQRHSSLSMSEQWRFAKLVQECGYARNLLRLSMRRGSFYCPTQDELVGWGTGV
jgi:hypothetical protein